MSHSDNFNPHYYILLSSPLGALLLENDPFSRWTGEQNPCVFSEKENIFLWWISTWIKTDDSHSTFKAPIYLKDSAGSLGLRLGGVGGGTGYFLREWKGLQTSCAELLRVTVVELDLAVQRPNGSLKAAALSEVAAAAERQPVGPVL